jgi:hypothetical protein
MKKPIALGMASLATKCDHCGRPVRQTYMVHDKVWALAGMPSVIGLLHIGCVEKRIGRRLTRRDFYYGWEYRR